jgi:glyoxylate utilization-related uncharacterized protein
MYHREKAQEAFLVLSGECTLIVEGKERRLVAWDFFYCPPETEHIIVAAAEQSKAAARYGASLVRETTDPAVAYARVRAKLPRSRFVNYRSSWLPEIG